MTSDARSSDQRLRAIRRNWPIPTSPSSEPPSRTGTVVRSPSASNCSANVSTVSDGPIPGTSRSIASPTLTPARSSSIFVRRSTIRDPWMRSQPPATRTIPVTPSPKRLSEQPEPEREAAHPAADATGHAACPCRVAGQLPDDRVDDAPAVEGQRRDEIEQAEEHVRASDHRRDEREIEVQALERQG